MKIRKEQRLKEKKDEPNDKKRVKFSGDREESEDSAEYFEDSQDEEDYHDSDDYDSENGEEEEKEPKITEEDPVETLKQAKALKPAEGVKFVQYDEYGVPLQPDPETGFDYQKHIVTDEMKPGDMFIEAPAEMVERMMAKPWGIRRDIDKDPS